MKRMFLFSGIVIIGMFLFIGICLLLLPAQEVAGADGSITSNLDTRSYTVENSDSLTSAASVAKQ